MRQHAAMAPMDAPDISFKSKCGTYFLKQHATPTWYIPKKPHPANDRFILALVFISFVFSNLL